jgi:tetratricopeptide (TPR) repeat protein
MAGRGQLQSTGELRPVTADELRTMVTKFPKVGARLIESAARQGLFTAQLTYARMLLVGQGVYRDREAAFHWFAVAAESGEPEAVNMLGRCYELGWGVAPDRKRAIQCYRTAARQNFAWAQFNLGQILISGDPTARQRREGLGWHLVAAKAGHAKSMNVLGRFCEEGWDMPKSADNAQGWYRKAAEAGDHWGQFNLGRLLAEDGEIEEAAYWFRKAVESKNEEFVNSIVPVLKDRPEMEFKAIARSHDEARKIKVDDTARAETEMPMRRQPRHRSRSWFSRRTPGFAIS